MKRELNLGFWSGLLAFLFTVAYGVVQLLQVKHVTSFPLDEILIYGTSLSIVIPFVIEMCVLHFTRPAERKFWSLVALMFTLMYAVFVTSNYVVQLATGIPMKLKGLGEEVKLLDQTPHSLFWNFDALGYIFMGLAMLFAVPSLNKRGVEKYARMALVANGLVTPLIAFVYFYPVYSEKVLIIGYPWALTAPLAMLMLALTFRTAARNRLFNK